MIKNDSNATKSLKNHSFVATICIVMMILNLPVLCSAQKLSKPRILVFSKTAGFRHSSIAAGKKAIQKLGKKHDFLVDTTENARRLTKDNLKKYAAIVFLNTTGNVLNGIQQKAFKHFINTGGGYLGVHGASDTEYHWPWYGRLVGAYFKDHPSVQKAKINTHYDDNFPGLKLLPDPWERTDEWYNFRSIPQGVHVLMSMDEHSYKGGKMGRNHPMVWYHKFDGGRSFYMEFGHTKACYQEPNFLKLLLSGIEYVAEGNN